MSVSASEEVSQWEINHLAPPRPKVGHSGPQWATVGRSGPQWALFGRGAWPCWAAAVGHSGPQWLGQIAALTPDTTLDLEGISKRSQRAKRVKSRKNILSHNKSNSQGVQGQRTRLAWYHPAKGRWRKYPLPKIGEGEISHPIIGPSHMHKRSTLRQQKMPATTTNLGPCWRGVI
jgi:hypothetical protein